METNLGKSLQFLAGAACSASFGWSLKHGLAEALNQRAWGDGVDEMHNKSKLSFSFSCRVLGWAWQYPIWLTLSNSQQTMLLPSLALAWKLYFSGRMTSLAAWWSDSGYKAAQHQLGLLAPRLSFPKLTYLPSQATLFLLEPYMYTIAFPPVGGTYPG